MSTSKTLRQLTKRHAKSLKLSQIRLDSDNETSEHIIEDVKRYGLLVPIIVAGPYKDDNDDSYYKIVDGRSRYVAMTRIVPLDTYVPCYVVDKNISDDKLQELKCAANISNRTDNKKVMTDYAKLLLKNRGEASQCQLAHLISSLTGFSDRYAKYFLHVCEFGSDNVINAMEQNEFSYIVLYELVRDHKSKAEQDVLLEEMKNKDNVQSPKRSFADSATIIFSGMLTVLEKRYGVSEDDFADIMEDILNELPEDMQVKIVGQENVE